ncbi:hypothetical protein FJZ36_01680 [Candidatus Poribacteria bacterium]|nr:hypothetical protein [Candidatus Poribacteria bacterium]
MLRPLLRLARREFGVERAAGSLDLQDSARIGRLALSDVPDVAARSHRVLESGSDGCLVRHRHAQYDVCHQVADAKIAARAGLGHDDPRRAPAIVELRIEAFDGQVQRRVVVAPLRAAACERDHERHRGSAKDGGAPCR